MTSRPPEDAFEVLARKLVVRYLEALAAGLARSQLVAFSLDKIGPAELDLMFDLGFIGIAQFEEQSGIAVRDATYTPRVAFEKGRAASAADVLIGDTLLHGLVDDDTIHEAIARAAAQATPRTIRTRTANTQQVNISMEWRPTPLPAARSRIDDVFFVDETLGWAVNSDGKVFKTEDGAESWTEQQIFPDSYLRCLAFTSPATGWIGTLSGPHRLYKTVNGGADWAPVENLPPDGPGRICGLYAVNDDLVFASGTNYPNEPAGVIRTTDGGATWTTLDLGPTPPTLLVDIFFANETTGWVVGGIDEVGHPARETGRRDVVPAVYATTDGGESWTNIVDGLQRAGELPRGEWGWKIQKLGDATLFVSLENFLDGAILRSDDLGKRGGVSGLTTASATPIWKAWALSTASVAGSAAGAIICSRAASPARPRTAA